MSLAAALRGETYRASRNPTAMVVGFWLAPIALFVIGFALEALMPANSPQLEGMLKANPVRQAAGAFAAAGNPLVQLFYAIGAAGLFAGEYRWETWRLIGPRASRSDLMLAKGLTFLLFMAASLALIGLGDFANGLYGPTINHLPSQWPASIADGVAEVGLAFTSGVLELAVLGAMVGFFCVVTRSVMGGVIPAFLFGFAELLLSTYLPTPGGLHWSLAIPRFAASAVLEGALSMRDGAIAVGTIAAALGALIAWTVGLTALTLAVFHAQDLSRE